MADEAFTQRAAQLAAQAVETELISASRDYEDAQRIGDESLAADAMRRYAANKRDYDEITGANQPQQQSGQLSVSQRNFLSRRAALGDDLTPVRMKDYALAHTRAVNAGLEVDSPQYFKAIETFCDTMTGDGHQPVLNEREAARVCGVSDEVYSVMAHKLKAMKRSGEYGGDQ
jgi:hypothetical protein